MHSQLFSNSSGKPAACNFCKIILENWINFQLEQVNILQKESKLVRKMIHLSLDKYLMAFCYFFIWKLF